MTSGNLRKTTDLTMIFRKSYESANFRNLLKYLRKKVTKNLHETYEKNYVTPKSVSEINLQEF